MPTSDLTAARAWRNAVFAIFTANGLAVATVLSRLPAIRDHLGIETSQVGLLILCFSLGSVVGIAFSSHIVHALGGRRTIRIMLSACGVGLVIVGIGSTGLESYVFTVAGAAAFGAASGVNDVAMNVEGAANERVLGRNIMPWFHAGFSLGTVIGAGGGSLAAALGVSVLVHGSIVAGVVVATALVAARALPAHDASGDDEPRPSFRERMSVWLEPRTLLIGLVVLGFAYTEGAANDWLPLALIDGRGLDNAQGALMLGVFTASMTVGRILGVFVLDRFGRVPVLLGTAALAAVGLSIVIFVPVIPIVVVGIVLWGLGASLGFPVGMSAAADDPARATARVGAVAMVGYVAFLVGPTLVGFVGEQVGILSALTIVLGLIVLAGAATPATRRPAPTASELAP